MNYLLVIVSILLIMANAWNKQTPKFVHCSTTAYSIFIGFYGIFSLIFV